MLDGSAERRGQPSRVAGRSSVSLIAILRSALAHGSGHHVLLHNAEIKPREARMIPEARRFS